MSRILVVEDDLAVGRTVQLALRIKGHKIDVATSLSLARNQLNHGSYDFVILDIHLPDGNGLDLLQHLRQAMGEETPVLLLSGVRQLESVDRGYELGAVDFITKPFSPRELLARVEPHVG
jgi:DNA-binding response OmpR family regulator